MIEKYTDVSFEIKAAIYLLLQQVRVLSARVTRTGQMDDSYNLHVLVFCTTCRVICYTIKLNSVHPRSRFINGFCLQELPITCYTTYNIIIKIYNYLGYSKKCTCRMFIIIDINIIINPIPRYRDNFSPIVYEYNGNSINTCKM